MFGIDDALIWGPLIGSAIGGLTNKKNPMEGALLGAGLGLAGGAAAPGLLGAGAASGTGLTAATGSGLSLAGPAAGTGLTAGGTGLGLQLPSAAASTASATPSALSGLKTAMGYVKPVGEAMQAANAAKGLLAPTPMTIQSGLPQRIPTDFGGLLAQGGLGELQQKRLARRGMA